MNNPDIVYIDPKGGWHYHKKGCYMIDRPSYIAIPKGELNTRVPKNSYQQYIPCPACFKHEQR